MTVNELFKHLELLNITTFYINNKETSLFYINKNLLHKNINKIKISVENIKMDTTDINFVLKDDFSFDRIDAIIPENSYYSKISLYIETEA